ncbi:hypothetical protein D1872_326660 [compost metagenome]
MFRTFAHVLSDAMSKLNQEYSSHDPQSHCHEQLYEAIRGMNPDVAVSWTLKILEGTMAEL